MKEPVSGKEEVCLLTAEEKAVIKEHYFGIAGPRAMTPHEALSELIRRGTRNDETARHTIVLRLSGDDLLLLAAILHDGAVSQKSADCHRTVSEDSADGRVANLKPVGEQREQVDSTNATTTRAYDNGDSRK